MIIKGIENSRLKGAILFKIGTFNDTRGFFTELYHLEELKKVGFHEDFVQDNLSKSQKGVLRGMHYQLDPHGMGKLVCCLSGKIYDVIVDLRKGSPTFGQWEGFHLSSDDLSLLWVPIGFAHGFLSQSDNTLVL
ncbi:MAG: dTDP-4-dehydrorhamnose 3,5-epimerase family protein, partial [Candidatus Hydrogenedens sp.]|nr:dTDP-4-dehydrorhamnose 3,5-epimerase family protein [Candidatus Hydrogenedens sp.]